MSTQPTEFPCFRSGERPEHVECPGGDHGLRFPWNRAVSLSQIALANFDNVEVLTEVGRSQLIEFVESGAPVIAGTNSGNLGSIRSSSLEKSNVDLAQQFVNLIVR
ncbi:MAG: hypothetical protein CL933_00065 [Deltaproteobacteria bacterium]|nr:hypothetical protein [Deltaproteobacteria bacterium]